MLDDGFPVVLDGPAEPAEELPVRERPEVQRRQRTYHDHSDEDGNERSGMTRCRAHQPDIPTVRALAPTAEPGPMRPALEAAASARPPLKHGSDGTRTRGLPPRSACEAGHQDAPPTANRGASPR